MNVAGSRKAKGIWGEFERALDERSRVMLPREIRDLFADEVFVSRGPENSVYVLTPEMWLEIWQELENAPAHDDTEPVRNFFQRLYGGASKEPLDRFGRLAIPKHLREWMQVRPGETVVMMGLGQRLELWSRENWQRYVQQFTREGMKEAVAALGMEDLLGSGDGLGF